MAGCRLSRRRGRALDGLAFSPPNLPVVGRAAPPARLQTGGNDLVPRLAPSLRNLQAQTLEQLPGGSTSGAANQAREMLARAANPGRKGRDAQRPRVQDDQFAEYESHIHGSGARRSRRALQRP